VPEAGARPQSSSSVASEGPPPTPTENIDRISQHRSDRQNTLISGLNFPIPGQAPRPFNSPQVNPNRPYGGHRPFSPDTTQPDYGSSPPDYPGSLRNMSQSPDQRRVYPSPTVQSPRSGSTDDSRYRSPPPASRADTLRAEIRSYGPSFLTRAQANLVNGEGTRESVLEGIAQSVRAEARARHSAASTGGGGRR
jgi:hypothetical protein